MCCGREMNQAVSSHNSLRVPVRPSLTKASPYRAVQAKFEYAGKTALTVVSPLSGKTYRFPQPGTQVSVDDRDRQWIAFIPHLKRCG